MVRSHWHVATRDGMSHVSTAMARRHWISGGRHVMLHVGMVALSRMSHRLMMTISHMHGMTLGMKR